MSLRGKVAIITGGTRGIGKSIALELSQKGASVVLNYKNDDESAKKTLEEIKNIGGYAILVKGDVSDYRFCKTLVTKVIDEFGKIDVLVNNAGISKVGLFIDMNEEDYNLIMDTNMKSIFNMCNNVCKYMIEKKSGNIINISSMWGNVGASCEVMYSASKGAVNLFTKALAKELAPSNIRVNAIAPGVINTEMNSWMSSEELNSMMEEIPLGRLGEGEDVAKAAAFLAGDESKYITGQIINVDGAIL
ncbi:MAG: SDR family oxidoreductase [Clostridium argentinense]|uniref:SDR family oxidoreductase n=1 Tax=Clostridium faecium TaxID=2762223 RepID=A0ABR8YNT3_9CLOT|nr:MULTISPECIES: SDR family oxidoreductase [Clostridium]MBD8045914.1 SDR family oxidoreductase [Clostridium faecium]MBS5822553.1 SDR family oxidoreductase [Clostridium argentinense]MDU1347992.1 SDR family oxidoreductase [Clostridium argentinense]